MTGTEIILRNENGEYSSATSEKELTLPQLGNLFASIVIMAGYSAEQSAQIAKAFGEIE